MTRIKKTAWYGQPCVIVVLLLLLSGCGGEPETESPGLSGEITISEAWARPAALGRVTAVYLRGENGSTEADTLISVSSDVAVLSEMHESYEQEGGMAGMREVTSVPLPPAATIVMEPGGLHVMLMQLRQALNPGDEIVLTLHFARSGEMDIPVIVREP